MVAMLRQGFTTCLGCHWFNGTAFRKLTIYSSGVTNQFINFASRGWVGSGFPYCTDPSPGTDSYVTSNATGTGTVCGTTLTWINKSVDVMGALRDGVWSGSVTIALSNHHFSAGSSTVAVAIDGSDTGCSIGSYARTIVCFTQTNTITVYDDGTVTLA